MNLVLNALMLVGIGVVIILLSTLMVVAIASVVVGIGLVLDRLMTGTWSL